ncbi:MAG TPA: cytochrome P450 [Acidimicrobiales bacterium]|nr:cytochrome P450 [Acidimicrobiales bacterium]
MSIAAEPAPRLDYNPYAPEIQHNPYPVYERMRREAPVYRHPELGFYALTRYDDVLGAMGDPATFISGEGVTPAGTDKGMGFLISTDPPDHTWLRKLLSRVFTPRRVGELEPFIRRVAARYLDALRDRARFDVVQDFALRLPLDVIGELIGLPADLRQTIHDLSLRAGARDPDPASAGRPSEDAVAAIFESITLLHELVVERRRHPQDDIISMLIAAEVVDDDGNTRRLSDELITAQFLLLAAAGHETVTNLVGNGTVALWWYPDQRAELARDPRLVANAVDEMLRWDNPAPIEGRWTTRDVELHGTTIPKDSRVLLLMGAANHDEQVFTDPELFDIRRRFERPIVFGFGVHRCLGANLARLEARVAFEELLARFPDYDIDADGVERGPANQLRGLHHLPLLPCP